MTNDQPMKPNQPKTAPQPQKPAEDQKPATPKQGFWKKMQALKAEKWNINGVITHLVPKAIFTVSEKTAHDLVKTGAAKIVDHNAEAPTPIVSTGLLNQEVVLTPHDTVLKDGKPLEPEKEPEPPVAATKAEQIAALPENLEEHLAKMKNAKEIAEFAASALSLVVDENIKKHVAVDQVLAHVKEHTPEPETK